jgi:hypothetical protein
MVLGFIVGIIGGISAIYMYLNKEADEYKIQSKWKHEASEYKEKYTTAAWDRDEYYRDRNWYKEENERLKNVLLVHSIDPNYYDYDSPLIIMIMIVH